MNWMPLATGLEPVAPFGGSLGENGMYASALIRSPKNAAAISLVARLCSWTKANFDVRSRGIVGASE